MYYFYIILIFKDIVIQIKVYNIINFLSIKQEINIQTGYLRGKIIGCYNVMIIFRLYSIFFIFQDRGVGCRKIIGQIRCGLLLGELVVEDWKK